MTSYSILCDIPDLDELTDRLITEVRARSAGTATANDVAAAAQVNVFTVRGWLSKTTRPTLAQLHQWASVSPQTRAQLPPSPPPTPPVDADLDGFVGYLTALRKWWSASQDMVAESLDVHPDSFSRWERRVTSPTRTMLTRWAALLGETVPGTVRMPRLTTAECGRSGGVLLHIRRGEHPCPACQVVASS